LGYRLWRAGLFQFGYGVAEPTLHCFLESGLVLAPLELIDRLPRNCQRDMMAGYILDSRFHRDEVDKETLLTRMWPARIREVQADWSVLKDRGWLPRRLHRSAVATLFDEFQFGLQDFKCVAIALTHSC